MTTKEVEKEVEKKIKDVFGTRKYVYAVGRRKEAVAQVRVFAKGSGKIVINTKDIDHYVSFFEYQKIIREPFEEIGKSDKYDVSVKVLGGGTRGQATAIRLGIARCLVEEDEGTRKLLKAKGFLKRDPRMKERKKPGLHGARRAPQWKKR